MRICIIYDCLFPFTIGGAERWCRNLAERLSAIGHEVTYLTFRQWPRSETPTVAGLTIVTVGPPVALYTSSGRRRMAPPLIFGAGVLIHLLRNGRRYDVVHTASFPYFSLIAAWMAQGIHRYRLVVDWHEVWSKAYWRRYLGPLLGQVGWAVQAMCLRIPQTAFCFAKGTATRLRQFGMRSEPNLLEGEYAGDLTGREPLPADPVVVFAARQIPEKRATVVAPAIEVARAKAPELRGVIFGDGPEHADVVAGIAALGAAGRIEAPGFVGAELVSRTLERALCLLHPSSREGYGLVVVEAAAVGTPVILVAGEDNAATELIEPGVNGFVVASPTPDDVAVAILRIRDAGQSLRRSTADWFARNAQRLSIETSLARVAEIYGAGPGSAERSLE